MLVNWWQHYDANMSDVFFDVLQMSKAKYNLEVSSVSSGKHGVMTARIVAAFEEVVEQEMPNILQVYGATNTSLAGALLAAKLRMLVANVRAGILILPCTMPEEINRILVDCISSLLLCPSQRGVGDLLLKESPNYVLFDGVVIYDLFKSDL